MEPIPGIDANENFAGQLRMLHGMGFQDIPKSRLALTRSNGRIQEAIDMLVNDNIPAPDPDEVPLADLAITTRAREALRELKSMGFTNTTANLEALRMSQYDVDKAYIILMEATNGPVKAGSGYDLMAASNPVSVPSPKSSSKKSRKGASAAASKSVSPNAIGEVTLADVLGSAPVWSAGSSTSSPPSRSANSSSRQLYEEYLDVDERYAPNSSKAGRSLSPNFRPVNAPSPQPSTSPSAYNKSSSSSSYRPPSTTTTKSGYTGSKNIASSYDKQSAFSLLSDIDFTEKASMKPVTVPVPPALKAQRSANFSGSPHNARSGQGSQLLELEDLQKAGLLPDFSSDNYLYTNEDPRNFVRTVPVPAAAPNASLLSAALNSSVAGGAATLEAAYASFKTPRSAADPSPAPPLPTRKEEADPFGDEYAVDPFAS
ncbi:hypothetical protein HDU97_000165 [Phlyctochytrium planicorne]|nr:hypothetical protein HDU97_000165 [Phlyctochytrium planicorne]